MGIFSKDEVEQPEASQQRIEIDNMCHWVVTKTFLSEFYLATYPFTEKYHDMDNFIDGSNLGEIEEHSEEHAKWIGEAITFNDWSLIKGEFRKTVDKNSAYCAEFPSLIIKAIAEEKDTELFKKFMPSDQQLEQGKRHFVSLITVPYGDNTLPIVGQLQSTQRLLNQQYPKYYEKCSSLWGGVKDYVEGAALGALALTGVGGLLLAGTRFAHTATKDSEEDIFLNKFYNYLEMIDEYGEHDESAFRTVLDELSPLIDEQAVPIIIRYIDLAIDNKIITEEYCHAVLEDLVDQTYLHYKETPAYVYFKDDEEGEEEIDDTE